MALREGEKKKNTRSNFIIQVREDGTRHLGCDESSGWVWYAARRLHQVLVEQQEQVDDGSTTTTTMALEHLRVLELGAGTGWLSLQLALLGAIVTCTDRKGALPLLLQNVMGNQERLCAITTSSTTNASDGMDEGDGDGATSAGELAIDVLELDWTDETARIPGEWDLAVGSDVLYLIEHHRPLLQTLIRHNCKHCVISWEQRKPKEEEGFLLLAQEMGFDITHKIDAGSNPMTNNAVWVVFLEYNNNNNNNNNNDFHQQEQLDASVES